MRYDEIKHDFASARQRDALIIESVDEQEGCGSKWKVRSEQLIISDLRRIYVILINKVWGPNLALKHTRLDDPRPMHVN